MADDLGDSEADDERTIELSSVAAIYPELLFDVSKEPITASIDIPVEPTQPLPLLFPPLADDAPLGSLTPPESTSTGKEPVDSLTPQRELEPRIQDIHYLNHLPPLTLQLSLPSGYPSEEPPVFFLEIKHGWLPEKMLQELRSAGHTIWEEMGRDLVVFSYIDYLREAAEQGFGLVKGDETVVKVSSELKIALLDFDLKAKRAKFERETFECGICLEPKKGGICHRLQLCSHVFCVECLQDFYNSCISEGDIGNVKCMAPNCGVESKLFKGLSPPVPSREDKTLEPSELLQIPLEQEMVQRYIKLKRKKRLESDRNTVYCPRQWCQGPAKVPNMKPQPRKSEPDILQGGEPQMYDRNANPDLLPPPAERLAICEDCTFAFCKVCKASWHGEYFTCFPRSQFELSAEEKASEDYMMLHTQPCPTCDARAQKTHGCNHMICFKCDTHFCYLCGAYLDKGNPYQHYNSRKSSCYMRLWELEAGDDGEFGHGFAGGGVHDFDSDDDDEDEIPPNAPAVPARHPVAGDEPHPQELPAAQQRNGDPALQRFLELALNDDEDAWDSDDMNEEIGDLEDWE